MSMKVWLLALVVLALGCDGIGQPIVAERPGARGAPPFMCQQPRGSCADVFLPRLPFAAPDLVTPAVFCGGALSELPCQVANQGLCMLSLQVVESIPVTLPMQRCNTLDLTPATGSARAELRGLAVKTSLIRLHAERPTTFVLDDVTIDDSALELRGPVSVEIRGRAHNVSVEADADASVTFTESTLSRMNVRMPNGSLRVQRSTLTTSRLSAREIELETVPGDDLTIDAERLIGIQLRGRLMRLDVRDLSLSETEVQRFDLHRCDDALFVNVRLNLSQLAACTNKLRANSSAILNSRADGRIESIRTYWDGMFFGSGAARTTLEVWQGTFNGSVLCPNLDRLALAEDTGAACNDCTQLFAPERYLCRAVLPSMLPMQEDEDAGVSTPMLYGGNELCPLLDEGLPLCDPQPVLTSPL